MKGILFSVITLICLVSTNSVTASAFEENQLGIGISQFSDLDFPTFDNDENVYKAFESTETYEFLSNTDFNNLTIEYPNGELVERDLHDVIREKFLEEGEK